MYSPQNSHDPSVFALAYSFRLRSCNSTGAFIISPLPPILTKPSLTAGPLRSTGVNPLPRYYEPVRPPLMVGRFPGVAGYTAHLTPTISRRDETGIPSCVACPGHPAVDNHPAGECRRINQGATLTYCVHPFMAGSTSEVRHFEATSRSLALRPDNSPSS